MRTLLACFAIVVVPAAVLGQIPEDLAQAPPNAIGLAHIRVDQLKKSPQLGSFIEIIERAGAEPLAILKKSIAPSLLSIDRVTVFVVPTVGRGDPTVGALIHVSSPYDAKALTAGLTKDPDGYHRLPSAGVLKLVSDTMFLIGADDVADALKKAPASPEWKSLIERIAATSGDIVAVLNVKTLPAQAIEGAPPPLQPLTRADRIVAALTVGQDLNLDVAFDFPDANLAKDCEDAINALRVMAKGILADKRREIEKQLAGTKEVVPVWQPEKVVDVVTPVVLLGMIERGGEILAKIPIARADKQVTAKLQTPPEMRILTQQPLVLSALLVPAVQKIRESARRVQAANNLKQLGLAFHIFHDNYKHLPSPAICDKEGKPLLSWRVAILPYIEQQALYEQFKLDEPWDSEHNKKLLAKMPDIFQNLERLSKGATTTHYQVIVGPDTDPSAMFRTQCERVKFRQITDGLSNTILIAESAAPVPWTKPEDIVYDPKGKLPEFFPRPGSGSLAAFCDGSVRMLSPTLSPDGLRAYVTRNGNDQTPLED